MAPDPLPARPEILLANADWVRALARSLASDSAEADDLEQETWLAALDHPAPTGGRLRPWLVRVLRNLVRKRRRTDLRRKAREEASAGPSPPGDPAALVERISIQQDVVRTVVALDEPYRSTLLLRYFEGLEIGEIARRQRIPHATVRQRLKRGRERLRERLLPRYGGDREAWSAAMLRLAETLRPHPAPLPPGVPVLAAAGKKVAVGIAATLLVGVVGWRAGIFPVGPPANPIPPTPVAEATPFPGNERETGRSADESRSPGAVRRAAVAASPATDGGSGDATASGRLVVRARWREDGRAAEGVVAVVGRPGSTDSWTACAETDDRGEVHFVRLLAGRFRAALWGGEEEEVLVAGGEEVRVELSVPRGFAVVGRVVDQGERGVPSADLWLSAPENSRLGLVVCKTDESGGFRLPFVTVDQFIGARAAGKPPSYLQSVRGRPGDEVRIRIVLEDSTARLAGSVFDGSGAPVAGASVAVTDPDRNSTVLLFDGRGTRNPPPQWKVTDGSGAFRFDSLAPRRLLLVVWARGFGLFRRVMEAPSTDEEEVRVTLEPEARVSGRVTDDRGRPVARARVERIGPESISRSSVTSDEDGRFELADLPAEEATFTARHDRLGFALVRLRPEAGRTKEWNPVLAKEGGLSGDLADASGRPLGGWSITVRDPSERDARETVVQTRSDGSFSVPLPPEGRLEIQACAPGAWTEFPALVRRDVDPDAGPIHLVLAEPDRTFGRILGAVADPEGKPSDDALVSVDSPGSALWRGFVPEAGTGRFEIERVPPGPCLVEVRPREFPWVSLGSLEVRAGEVVDVGAVRLRRGGTLSGEITGAAEASLATLEIELAAEEWKAARPVSRTGKRFWTGSLAPGRYRLSVRGDGLWSEGAECEVEEGLAKRVEIAVERAGLRRALFELPPDATRPGWLWCEVYRDEEPIWVWGMEPSPWRAPEARISVPPGVYRLHAGTDTGLSYEGPLEMGAAGEEGPSLSVPLR
ncbi:MAG: sigma-70 family RNA polymerase sigma factor [Planctomycetes bacterium]|nr:sigma-70 family RNA polymerase sigma factor [Planctomycetota bacterium]